MTMQEYFDSTVNKVLTQIGCTMDIDISILDHDTLTGKKREALGICWKNEKGTYKITIDEFLSVNVMVILLKIITLVLHGNLLVKH